MNNQTERIVVSKDLTIKVNRYLDRDDFEALHAATRYRNGAFTIPLSANQAMLETIRKAYRTVGYELQFTREAFQALRDAKKVTLTKLNEGVAVQSQAFIKDLLDDDILKNYCRFDGSSKRWYLRQTGAVLIAKKAFERAGVEVTLNGFEFDHNLPTLQIPANKNVQLLPFQKKGVKFIFAHDGRAGLFDDVGLGKTIQTVEAILELARKGKTTRVLIIAPSALLYQWASELQKKFNLEPTLVTSRVGKDERATLYVSPLVLVSYELFRQDHKEIGEKHFDTVVLDEVTRVKNWNTKTSDAVKNLVADNVIALTGTPVENRLAELFNIVNIIKPGFFGRWRSFVDEYGYEDRWHNVSIRSSGAAAELRRKLSKISVRRTKRQVLKELPDLVTQWVQVQLAPNQKALYDFLDDEITQAFKQLESLRVFENATELPEDFAKLIEGTENPLEQQTLLKINLLREVCADITMIRNYVASIEQRQDKHAEDLRGQRFFKVLTELINKLEEDNAKLAELLELLDEIVEEHKVVVFTQYATIVDVVSKALTDKQIGHVTLTGKMTVERKNQNIQRFVNDPKIRIMLSTDTGQYGLNLQVADVIINYDLPWNPARLYQRVGRIHRIGQEANKVLAINLILEDTIEEKMKARIEDKQKLFHAVTGTNLLEAKQVSLEEIKRIFFRT